MTMQSDNLPPLMFSDNEFARRHALVRDVLDKQGLAALVVYGTPSSTGAIQYLTGFGVTREALLVFPRTGATTLFVQMFNHLPQARQAARVRDVRWGGAESALTLTEHLRHRELAGQRLGLAGPLPWQFYTHLKAHLDQTTFVDVSEAVQRCQWVKSDEELAFLRRGAALSDRAMSALEQEARPGLTEHALAAIVEQAYVPLGGQTHIHYMASTRMNKPTVGVPAQRQTSRVLQPGDVLITEISAQFEGYAGQIQRPFAIGTPPTAAYQRLYEVAFEAFQRIAAVVRAGATAAEVIEAAECIHAAGYSIYDDLVHGFGGGYLPPIVRTRQTGGSRHASLTFEENMTIVIQPNVITEDAHMGLQVGELVRVTQTGVESLHQFPMRFVQCG